jgi:hypothetical protein
MFGIPLEVISMAASALGGFWLTHSANQAERLHEERLAYTSSVKAARADSSGVIVRRFIVIVMMSLLAFIVVGPAFLDIDTVIVKDGWLWGTNVTTIDGIMYDETIRMIITSIIGYYFGTSSAGR